MQKRHLGLAILLLTTVIIISGCGQNSDNQPASANNATNNQNQNQVNNQANETVNPSGSYSVNELFSMNRPMKCTWKESATGNNDVTNIIYINGKKFYQDVTMGDIGHSFTIYDGEYLYIWNDFNEVASKMKNTGATIATKPGQGAAGLDQKKDFICESWTADNSIFNPPQGKNFKDVTEEMNQAVQGLGSGGLEKAKQQVCDLCRQAPTQELRDECSANAQCN